MRHRIQESIPPTHPARNASHSAASIFFEKPSSRSDFELPLKMFERTINANKQNTRPTALICIRVQGVSSIHGFRQRRKDLEGRTNMLRPMPTNARSADVSNILNTKGGILRIKSRRPRTLHEKAGLTATKSQIWKLTHNQIVEVLKCRQPASTHKRRVVTCAGGA
jgi:hypothetical protein